MGWKDVGQAVSKFAPLLGTALGGPAAGGAVSLLLGALGLGGGTTPEQVANMLGDPATVIKLKEMENTHQVSLGHLALQIDQGIMADKQNARGREIEITKATGTRDTNLYLLAWTVIAGFFGITALLTFRTMPEVNVGPVNQLYGALAMGFGAVIGYFFGSSQSSDLKTRIMGMMTSPIETKRPVN
jgi:hypothetical protein